MIVPLRIGVASHGLRFDAQGNAPLSHLRVMLAAEVRRMVIALVFLYLRDLLIHVVDIIAL